MRDSLKPVSSGPGRKTLAGGKRREGKLKQLPYESARFRKEAKEQIGERKERNKKEKGSH